MKLFIYIAFSFFVFSCSNQQSEVVVFDWDKAAEEEEVKLMNSYMEGYSDEFSQETRSLLQSVYMSHLQLIESYNSQNHSDKLLGLFIQGRKDLEHSLGIKRLGEDKHEQKLLALNPEKDGYQQAATIVHEAFLASLKIIKGQVTNTIQARNTEANQ